jgi:hypothetical protein
MSASLRPPPMEESRVRQLLSVSATHKHVWELEGITPATLSAAPVDDLLKGPDFRAVGREWFVRLYLGGWRAENAGHVSLFLRPTERLNQYLSQLHFHYSCRQGCIFEQRLLLNFQQPQLFQLQYRNLIFLQQIHSDYPKIPLSAQLAVRRIAPFVQE